MSVMGKLLKLPVRAAELATTAVMGAIGVLVAGHALIAMAIGFVVSWFLIICWGLLWIAILYAVAQMIFG